MIAQAENLLEERVVDQALAARNVAWHGKVLYLFGYRAHPVIQIILHKSCKVKF